MVKKLSTSRLLPFLLAPGQVLIALNREPADHQNNNGRNQRLIALAFAAAVGITLLVLGCALNDYQNWWPLFVLTFYILVPIPTVVSRRLSGSFDGASNACSELAIFLTTGIVVSCLGLPIILARASVIQWGACALTVSGSIVVFLTILGYFYVFAGDDWDYSSW